MGLGVIVIANDFTALNVALPSIEHDFNVDVGTVQWVINAYALTFGMAIVAGGRFADMFGRRKRVLHRRRPLRRLLAARRDRPGLVLPDRDARGHGHRRSAHVARDPRHDLRGAAGVQGRPGRRPDPRGGRHRQRARPAPRRPAHRRALLALDLLPERADRGVRRARHVAQGPPAEAAGRGRADRLQRDRDASPARCCCSSSRSTRPPTGASATRGWSRCSSSPRSCSWSSARSSRAAAATRSSRATCCGTPSSGPRASRCC